MRAYPLSPPLLRGHAPIVQCNMTSLSNVITFVDKGSGREKKGNLWNMWARAGSLTRPEASVRPECLGLRRNTKV